jgi:hypothetical protein
VNRDRWGRPLSAGAEAATLWPSYVEQELSYGSRTSESLHAVVDADPTFAVGRALAALRARLDEDVTFDVDTERAAMDEGRADSDWERSWVATVRAMLSGWWAAYPQLMRHHERFPDDLVATGWALFLTSSAAAPDRLDRMARVIDASAAVVGEHPFVTGAQAMSAQERHDLDRAHRLAQRVLELSPAHIWGAHPMAHVYFEGGDHAAGLAWLGGWELDEHTDRASGFFPHLLWHGALHQLALGDADGVRASYRTIVGADERARLMDGSSLLWRCQLVGHVPMGSDLAEPTLARTVGRGEDPSLTTFFGMHRALALATGNDADGLRRLAADAASWAVPGAAELLPGLARSLAAYVESSFAAAADGLLALEPQLVRFGGSHAQREVLEDTLISALVEAGRFEEALVRLDERLDRRESRLDRRLVDRADRRPR